MFCRLGTFCLWVSLLWSLAFAMILASATEKSSPVVVGGKMFTEGYVLAEAVALLLEHRGVPVQVRSGLGGTLVAYEALVHRAIDTYPDYTGTLAKVILQDPSLSQDHKALEERLRQEGLQILGYLGFNNTYALAVPRGLAQENNLVRISDLKGHHLRAAFGFEFIEREDGWRALAAEYGLDFDVQAMEHSLTYEAVGQGEADILVTYSTEAKAEEFNLVVLDDDLKFFPEYQAVLLAHENFPILARQALKGLWGNLTEQRMLEANASVESGRLTYRQAATQLLTELGLLESQSSLGLLDSTWWPVTQRILSLTWVHILLVGLSTLAAVLVAVPVGILLTRFSWMATSVLQVVGLLQTIPSIALLVYMIPWLGVTREAALMALFLYSLLPILQNTYAGIKNVDPGLVQAARGIGLYRREILWQVELPLALPILIAGIRTAAVINVGTATIAAFIGSGGLGELIVQGLTLNNMKLMQQGAIPAALLAIAINLAFNHLEKRLDKAS